MATLILSHEGITLKEYALTGDRMTIGRRSDNSIQLDDPTVSSVHAVLSLQPDPYLDGEYRVTVVDFNSTNGVFVNGEKVKQHKLKAGDIIRIGQHELLFNKPQSSPHEQTAVILDDKS